MTRKGFFAALCAPFMALGAGVEYPKWFNRPERHIYVNCQEYCPIHEPFWGGSVRVDGKEIRVWLVDTRMGLVKSYDIHQDGGQVVPTYTGWEGEIADPLLGRTNAYGKEIVDEGGILSITLRGRIEIYSPSGERIYG